MLGNCERRDGLDIRPCAGENGDMSWKKLLAYISGSVDEELLKRNEYLGTENRILRGQIKGQVRLTDTERISLARIGKELGKRTLEQVATIVKPATILGWQRSSPKNNRSHVFRAQEAGREEVRHQEVRRRSSILVYTPSRLEEPGAWEATD